MYGVEAQTSGLGGLAAQAPPDVYFPQALAITSQTSSVGGGPPTTGVSLPNSAAGEIQTPAAYGALSGSGTAVRNPTSHIQSSWGTILDFHNSPLPWILVASLFLYGWLHLSVRARAGRAGAAVVL